MKEAQERKITVEKELLDGTFLVPDTMTVEEMLYKWIPIQSTKHKWSPKTYTQSVAMVQNLIVPYIGKRKVQELRTYDIEKFYATLAKTPISAPKMAQDKPEYAVVRESLEENAMASGVSTQFFGRAGVQGAGDYRRFVCGVGVSAYHHSAGVGLITGRIHTSRDTVCRQENLDYLAKSLADAAQKMNDL